MFYFYVTLKKFCYFLQEELYLGLKKERKEKKRKKEYIDTTVVLRVWLDSDVFHS